MRLPLVRFVAVASLVLSAAGIFSSAPAIAASKRSPLSHDIAIDSSQQNNGSSVEGSENGSPAALKEITAHHEVHGVTIAWRARHTDVSYFHVLRSVDGKTFEQLANIDGLHSRKHKLFAYLDKQAPVGTIYYRIDITDLKGARATAGTLTVKVSEPHAAVSHGVAQP